jgi:cell division protein FtsN
MNYRDEFDDPRGSGLGFLGSVGPKAAFFVVLIALSFMVGVVWKLYVGSGSGPVSQDVPIVRADENPFKVEPDEPGGMEIPHKDSTIFSSLNDDEAKVENLLADDNGEEPMPRSQLFSGLNTDQAADTEGQERINQMTEDAKEVVEGMIDEGVESVMPAPPDMTAETEAPAKVEVKVEPEPVAVSPKVEAVKETVPPAAGDYYIQLGSVKSEDGAESEWKKIVAKYPSILSGYGHRVESADLGDKGVFYRIQAGPVSQEAATSACNAIKKIDANGCLVKKN